MTKIFSKKPLAIFSVLGAAIAIYLGIMACADGDWGPDYNSNITPETFVGNQYSPFFFDSNNFYYGIYYDVDANSRFTEQNIDDWSKQLGSNFSRNFINYYLYNANQYDAAQSLKHLENRSVGLNDSLQIYRKQLVKGGKKLEEFLEYLSDIKVCEYYAVRSQYSWDIDKPQTKPDDIEETMLLAARLKKGLESKQSDFVRQRYLFQLVRYYYFNEEYELAIGQFEDYKEKFPTNEIFYRTMGYCAGSLYKLKRYSTANYYYSLMFAGSDMQKTVAHFSFHPQDENDWNNTLSMCKNTDQKATLWQMLGIFYGDEFRSIREIYQLDPASKKLDVLVTRLLNKIETDYSRDYFDNEMAKKEYFSKLNQNIEKYYLWFAGVVNQHFVSNPFLWKIATGYLAFLQNDTENAKKYFAMATADAPKTELAAEQLRLLNLLASVGGLKNIYAETERTLLPEFQWILKSEKFVDYLRTTQAISYIKNRMSELYIKQGEYHKAECFVHDNNNLIDKTKLEQYKNYITKPQPTDYDKLCSSIGKIKITDVWEFEAITATFSGAFENACEFMKHTNTDVELPGNPFNGKIQDDHDADHAAPQRVKYTKLSFLEKLKELQDNIDKKNDVYNNALLIGNALYNISFYGNARAFYYSGVIDDYASTPEYLDSLYRPMLIDCKRAKKYYQLAFENATTDEQRAKCTYLQAKCERNEWYNETFYNSGSSDYRWNREIPDFIEWNSFRKLKAYSNTKYYRDVIAECGYFEKVVKNGNRLSK